MKGCGDMAFFDDVLNHADDKQQERDNMIRALVECDQAFLVTVKGSVFDSFFIDADIRLIGAVDMQRDEMVQLLSRKFREDHDEP